MPSTHIELPTTSEGEDPMALAAEFQQLNRDLQRSNEIERKLSAGEPISDDERSFLELIPEKCRRACDITRILRRTNTGPAKVKTKSPRASRAKSAQEEIDKLMDM